MRNEFYFWLDESEIGYRETEPRGDIEDPGRGWGEVDALHSYILEKF